MFPQEQQQIQRPMGGNGRYRGFMMGRQRQQMRPEPQSQAMPGGFGAGQAVSQIQQSWGGQPPQGAPPTTSPAPTGPTMTKDPATGQAVWGMPAPPEHSVDPTPPQSPMPGGGGAPPPQSNQVAASATLGQGRDLYQQQRQQAQAWRPQSEMMLKPRMPQQRNNMIQGPPVDMQDQESFVPRQRPNSGIVY